MLQTRCVLYTATRLDIDRRVCMRARRARLVLWLFLSEENGAQASSYLQQAVRHPDKVSSSFGTIERAREVDLDSACPSW